MNTITSLSPQNNRIYSIDVLRGIAVLGMLIINIRSFSMISAAYINPMAYGELTGLNKTVWIFSHIFADQKFMSIFSMLFGAGILLFSDNIEGKGYLPARFYYRRLFWLFTFGLIHGYLFWHGDILVLYAVVGALAFLFRKLSPWVLLVLGMIIFFIPSFNYWLFGKSVAMWPPEAVASLKAAWAPDQISVENEIAALRGSIREQLVWRIPETFKMQTFILLIWMGWRALAMMLMGMGLLKLGILSASVNKKFYAVSAVLAIGVGVTLSAIGVQKNFAADWAVEYSMFFGWQWNYIGSLFSALGYVFAVMLLSKTINMNLFARIGRLAFTNYILMTLICSTIFYGHGAALFSSVDGKTQMIFVAVIWIIVIFFSYFWSKNFYYGPIEWLWRYLTYGNKPNFRKKII